MIMNQFWVGGWQSTDNKTSSVQLQLHLPTWLSLANSFPFTGPLQSNVHSWSDLRDQWKVPGSLLSPWTKYGPVPVLLLAGLFRSGEVLLTEILWKEHKVLLFTINALCTWIGIQHCMFEQISCEISKVYVGWGWGWGWGWLCHQPSQTINIHHPTFTFIFQSENKLQNCFQLLEQ